MRINLRKSAAAIQAISKEMVDLQGRISSSYTYSVNIYEDLDAVVNSKNQAFKESIEKYKIYNTVLYSLRKKVDEANYKNSVNSLLNKIEEVKKLIFTFSSYPTNDNSDIEVVRKKIESSISKVHKIDDSYFSVQDTFTVSYIDDEYKDKLNSELKSLKRELRKLQDELLEANVNSTIELTTLEENILIDLSVI